VNQLHIGTLKKDKMFSLPASTLHYGKVLNTHECRDFIPNNIMKYIIISDRLCNAWHTAVFASDTSYFVNQKQVLNSTFDV
jgi:hypothetical protein